MGKLHLSSMAQQCSSFLPLFTTNGFNPCYEQFLVSPSLVCLSLFFIIRTFFTRTLPHHPTHVSIAFYASSAILIVFELVEAFMTPSFVMILVVSIAFLFLYARAEATMSFILLATVPVFLHANNSLLTTSPLFSISTFLAAARLLVLIITPITPSLPSVPPPISSTTPSFLSQYIYSFITPLVKLAHSRTLTANDIFPAPSHELHLSHLLTHHRLLTSIFIIFAPTLAIVVPLCLLRVCCDFVSPLIQKHIFASIAQNKQIWSDAFIILLVSLFSAFITQRSFYHLVLLKLKIERELAIVSFSKLLRLSQNSTDNIISLLTVDISRISRFIFDITNLVRMLPSFCIALVMTFWLVGHIAIYGLISTVVFLLPLFWLLKKQRDLRRQCNVLRDARVHRTEEYLQNIRGIKLEGLDDVIHNKLAERRALEAAKIRRIAVVDSCIFALSHLIPVTATIVTFSFVYLDGHLDAATAFPVLTVFGLLQRALRSTPRVVSGLTETKLAIDRFSVLFASEEVVPVENTPDAHHAVRMRGSFAWDTEPVLSGLDVTIDKGKLVMVIGQVSSGKTTFINSILGETARLDDSTVQIDGTTAFVSNTSWLRNDSIRNNITMSAPYDEQRFADVIDRCQLGPDLKTFPHGVETEVGERGITLSGGQKQRIALARALYLDADIYIFDDVLSAVDTHVSAFLFEHVFLSFLAAKTRVICTHQLQYLPHAEQIILLDAGKVLFDGTYAEYLRSPHATSFSSPPISPSPTSSPLTPSVVSTAPTPLMTVEHVDNSIVSIGQFWQYIKRVGLVSWLIFIALLSCEIGFKSLADFMLTFTPVPFVLYIVFHLFSIVSRLFRFIQRTRISCSAATAFHNQMFDRILHASFRFLDTTPVGRILNRFTKDLDTLEGPIFFSLNSILIEVINLSILIFINVSASIFFVPFVLLIAFLYSRMVRRFLPCSQNLKRLESTTRSPYLSLFNETVPGVSTLRAHHLQDVSIKKIDDVLLQNQAAVYTNLILERWFSLRIDVISALIIFVAIIVAPFGTGPVSVLAINYSIASTGSLIFLIYSFSELQNNFVSVERVLEYCDLPVESVDDVDPRCQDTSWPAGDVEFRNVSMRYRESLPLVLHNVSFSITKSEKIGVCGRTGSGKSSLLQVLFKAVPCDGEVFVGDVELRGVPHVLLRKRLGMIPQDPLVFEGTIRANIDPFGTMEDSVIQAALHDVGLDEYFPDLNKEVEVSGKNLSSGGKQLLCIARECLRPSSIIVLDEATSSVDYETDQLMQKAFRKVLTDKTVITIAHRLQTILDSDRIFVMEDGRVVESGTPDELLTLNGVFASLLQQSQKQLDA